MITLSSRGTWDRGRGRGRIKVRVRVRASRGLHLPYISQAHVDAARCDVGDHEQHGLARAEAGERDLTRRRVERAW